MPITRSRKSLSGVAKVMFPLTLWCGSLEQYLYGIIKRLSWKDLQQTRFTAVARAVQVSYRLPIFTEIMVIAGNVGDRPAAIVAPEHILESFAVRIWKLRKSRHWPTSKAGKLARVAPI